MSASASALYGSKDLFCFDILWMPCIFENKCLKQTVSSPAVPFSPRLQFIFYPNSRSSWL